MGWPLKPVKCSMILYRCGQPFGVDVVRAPERQPRAQRAQGISLLLARHGRRARCHDVHPVAYALRRLSVGACLARLMQQSLALALLREEPLAVLVELLF